MGPNRIFLIWFSRSSGKQWFRGLINPISDHLLPFLGIKVAGVDQGLAQLPQYGSKTLDLWVVVQTGPIAVPIHGTFKLDLDTIHQVGPIMMWSFDSKKEEEQTR